MTSISALLRPKFQTIIESTTDVFEFDAVSSERHTSTTTPTEHPIEDGGVISDHSTNDPDEVEITGLVTSRPIAILAAQTTKRYMDNGLDGRPAVAWRLLRSIRTSKQLVTVRTEWRVYRNMQIVSDSVTRDPRTGKVLEVTVRLREVRYASVRTGAAPDPVSKVDKPEKKRGPLQSGQASKEVTDASNVSFAKRAKDYVTDAVKTAAAAVGP